MDDFAGRVHPRRCEQLGLSQPCDPTTVGPRSQGSNRVNQGGSWNNSARNCRSADRNGNDPSNRNNNLGFRVCLSSVSVLEGSDPEPTVVPTELCKRDSANLQ